MTTVLPRKEGGRSRRDAVEAAVVTWTKQLIDLGGRNRLLFYRDLKAGTMDLTSLLDGNPERFRELLEGKPVLVSRLARASQLDLLGQDDPLSDSEHAGATEDVERLAKRARTLAAKAKENYEEKGLHTLQLGWGLATWVSERSDSLPAAPVALRQVVLESVGSAGRDYSIRLEGDWSINGVLLHVLGVDFDVSIDEDALLTGLDALAESGDASSVFGLLRDACAHVAGFRLDDRLVIANFSYAKLPIAHDLELSMDRLFEHDVIAAIAGDDDAKAAVRERAATAGDVTAELPPEDEFLILDADSSQSVAINAVVRGAHTVIQGPPGTGKSQTIANLIATSAARGKTVLFVAEKRAAIDAVLRRLDHVGLGSLVLDLHDGTSNRKRIAEGLADALAHASTAPLDDASGRLTRLTTRRHQLDIYCEALRREREPWGLSMFAAQSGAIGTPPGLRSSHRVRRAELERLDAQAMRECAEAMRTYVSRGGPRLAQAESAWRFALEESTIPTADSVERTHHLLEQMRDESLPQLALALASATSALGQPGGGTIADWMQVPGLLERAAVTVEQLTDSVFQVDVDSWLDDLRRGLQPGVAGLLVRLRDAQFRVARKCAKALCVRKPANLEELVGWLEHAASCARDWHAVLPATVPGTYEGVQAALAAALSTADADAVPLLAATGLDVRRVTCGEAERAVVALLADQEWLFRLPVLTAARRSLEERGLGPVRREIDEVACDSAGDAEAMLRYVWLASILESVRMSDPVFAAFDGGAQQDIVDEFRELDKEHVSLTAARVRRACAERLTTVRDCHPEESEVVVRQAMLKKRHLPMRDLLPRSANVLLALKPCWAMSPLVVSQVLPSATLFDLVVFDEASQVPPWDAVSSIMRGRTVVVAGDRKQLPPTTFFMAADDGALEEEVEDDARLVTQDLESVLDVMANVLPDPVGTRTLNWHYRSRDERLIAFSNASFYGHQLTTFPGVDAHGCLRHHLVSPTADPAAMHGSAHDEVVRVVDLVLEHAAERPDESLGVIAMGIKHADRITEAVRLARLANPELDGYITAHVEEPFFVKNLERVQGDERDAIIITVGYGRGPDGRMRYVFGPINNEGGERRLNVAVTRAKRRLDIVSTFSAADMDPQRLKSEGARILRDYLEYAQSGGASLPGRQMARPELNAFEADVGERLERAGIPVVPQYGVSGYYIDFAAGHPEQPGKMVLAIECDGEKYHRSPTARDRDRLRQEHLERLGWRFVRIWSSEWARDPERQVERVRQAYESAIGAESQTLFEPDGDVAPAPPLPGNGVPSHEAPLPSRKGARPLVPHGLLIDDYSTGDLVRLLEWIQSDTLLRTRDEMLTILVEELGFRRRGKKIVAACQRAIDAYPEKADPERLKRSRGAHADGFSTMGVKVHYDMSVGWRYRTDAREVGPLTWVELWKAAHRGELRPATEVWHAAYGEWRPAGKIAKLFT